MALLQTVSVIKKKKKLKQTERNVKRMERLRLSRYRLRRNQKKHRLYMTLQVCKGIPTDCLDIQQSRRLIMLKACMKRS